MVLSVKTELCLVAVRPRDLTRVMRIERGGPVESNGSADLPRGGGLYIIEDMGLPMREEIVVSWFRSVRSGVRADRLEVPYDADVDEEGRLAWAAGPVLEGIADELAGTTNALVLTDASSHVLVRQAPDRILRSWLDRIQLAPGFRYGENQAGTNAIGTALAVQRPFVVDAGEHFAEVLSTMACAAVPITDPRTGVLLGAVDLSCRAEHASPLMLPFARRVAWEIGQRLLEDTSAATRLLREHFVRARRRTKDPLVSVSGETLFANAAATRELQPGDHQLLWEWVARTVAGHQPVAGEVVLGGGAWTVRGFEPVQDGGAFVGACLRLAPPSSAVMAGAPFGPGDRPRFGWASLTATELSIAELVAEGMTNREVAAKLYLSPHTVGFHLRQVFRKLEISSRVELTRLVVERRADGGAS
ncbi:MAG: sigma-54 dependent transcriptional regulator, acetoin dehydrogenase operon transcriptional [Actinomycetota bacterium]|jgi:DNA-binding CsgD family transcriptional regulator|nr:sigma-54 dependent transcriptional regulator, acetoin dehydrogenase operon transcriptional [Actinomycetota bacterium]MDQ1504754.1 sigma-54 dependent transcriptional regulator, acetoin dehydrogenase operon transcriptional [Actinomycetota bacterium]